MNAKINLSREKEHLDQGDIYLKQKKYSLAKVEYLRVLEINSNNEYAFSGLGHLYLQQINYKSAIENFQKAVLINLECESAHFGLGIVYLEQELYNLAEIEFNKTLSLNFRNRFAHQMQGYVYSRLGKQELSVQEFIKATDLYFEQERKVDLSSLGADKFRVKILRMPTFHNEFEINSTELNTSLLPPLALGQITAHLKKQGFTVEQDDLNIKIYHDNYFSENEDKHINTSVFFDEIRVRKYLDGNRDQDIEEIMLKIEKKTSLGNYNAVLFSFPIIFSNSSGLMFSLVLAHFIKSKYNPIIIVGGGNQSIELLTKYNCKNIDFIVFGDGEIILMDLLAALKDRDSLDDFLSSQVKQDRKLISSQVHPPIKPDFSGLPLDKYRYQGLHKSYAESTNKIIDEFNKSKTLILPVKFIKGCPRECTFCPESSNKTIFVLNSSRSAKHLKDLQNEYKPSGFFFLSDTLNISKQFINDFCDEMLKYKVKISWTDSVRADNLDKDTLVKMRKAGCIRLIFGMETASAKLLSYVNKKIGLKGLQNILKWSDQAGIWNGLEVICGLPYEKEEDIAETISFISNNREYINTLYFNQFGLRDGSLLLKHAEDFGIENIRVLNQYANEDFTYFHKYGYDEKNGLKWDKKKEQILYSHRKLLAAIDWNIEFPIFEFEHFLFFLYAKFKEKSQILKIFNAVAEEKCNLIRELKNVRTQN